VAAWGTLAQHLGPDGQRVVDSVGRKLGVGASGEAFRQAMLAAGGASSLPAGATGMTAAIGAAIAPAPLADEYLTATLWEDSAAQETPPVISYPTGFKDLDDRIGGGISTRQLATLCAPPASGKSGFVIQLGLNLEPLVPVLIVSTELERAEMNARLGANVQDLVWRDAVRGHYREEIRAAARGRRIYMIGCDELPSELTGPNGSLALIAKNIYGIYQRHGRSPVTFVDYLQDMVDEGADQYRGLISALARKLRLVAQETSSAIVAVSSVARTWYSPKRADDLRQSDDATQYLSAAKESGGVDFASAVVMFIDVDHTQGGPSGKPGRIAVAKSRHGETGFAGFRFFGASGRFVGDGSAVAAVTTATTGKGAVKGIATRAGASAQDDADVNKVIATVRHGAQPKATLKEVCGIPPARAARAIEFCLAPANRLLVLRPEGFDRFGRMSKTMLVDLPNSVPATATAAPGATAGATAAPVSALPGVALVQQPRVDPALVPLQAQFVAGFPAAR
jgi:hypothetical protein